MGQAPKEAERNMAVKFVRFKWKTVTRGSGRAESWMDSFGKKGFGSSGELPGQLRPYKSGHRGLGALDGARKRRGLSKVHPEVLDERRQQFFKLLDTTEKRDHFVAGRRLRLGGRERKRRGAKIGLLRQLKDSGKWDGKSNGLSGAPRKER